MATFPYREWFLNFHKLTSFRWNPVYHKTSFGSASSAAALFPSPRVLSLRNKADALEAIFGLTQFYCI